jgi:AcrR family transcriptional regulator
MTKADRTRQLIIEKAAPILNQKGMAGTAISDIMKATKLAKGGIYGNFEDKDEICLEAFNHLTRGLTARIDAAMEHRDTAKEKLFALLDYYRDALLLDDRGGCPILNFGTEADDTNPVIRKRVKEAIRSTQARISRFVSAGVQNGEFNASVDPQAFAVKMFAMIEGGILVSRIQHSNSQMKQITEMLKTEIEGFSK